MEKLRIYLKEKKQVSEELPFGPDTLVFKVSGKMFALVAWDENPLRINLKCDPRQAQALRVMYPSVLPGYHMNKEHWNTIVLDGSISDDEILKMVDHSYELVVSGLSKKLRDSIIWDN